MYIPVFISEGRDAAVDLQGRVERGLHQLLRVAPRRAHLRCVRHLERPRLLAADRVQEDEREGQRLARRADAVVVRGGGK